MTNTNSQELKPCPFCGGRARKELGKRKTCQLHGDPYQDTIIRCPLDNCVRMEGVEAVVIAKWNSRPTPAIVEGLKRWEYEYEMGNLTKALEGFEREHESDPKKVRILMGRYAMALASAKNVIDSLTPRPTPVSLEGLREKIEARIDKHESIGYGEDDSIRAEECRDILSLIDSLTPHPDTPEPSGEETTTIRTRIVKNHADGSSELISDTTRQGNPKPINPVSPPKTDQEIISEAVRDFAKFYDGVTANGSSSMVDRFLTERFNHPPKTEGGYKCEGCGCDTDMIQPYCHQCEHESIVKNEVRLALEEASQAILSKRFFAERGHFGGEQAVRVKDIQQAFITPLTNK
jgi:hypothetical protein